MIETLYQAVEDADAWPGVMRLLCQYLRADSGLIRLYSPNCSTVAFTATYGFDPSSTAAYQRCVVRIDPNTGAIRHLAIPPVDVTTLLELIPVMEGERTEFCDTDLPAHDKHHIMGGDLFVDDDTRIVIGLQRGHLRQPFTVADKSSLRILIPHFRQVMRMGQTLCRARGEASAAVQALDNLKVAVFFLDRQGDVRFANAQAESEVRGGLLLTLRERRLHAVRPGRDRILQQLIASATGSASSLLAAGGVLQLAACHEVGHTVVAVVTPWLHPFMAMGHWGPGLTSAVFVGAPERPRLQATALASAFGLTGAEARLVSRLVETCDLAKAANAAGVTISTARGYLKSIFEKTSCRSQLELVTLVLTSPSGLWGRTALDGDKVHAISVDSKASS